MKIDITKIISIIAGSTVLGTGGGGRYDDAIDVVNKLSGVDLISFDELNDEDIVITAYGVGSLTKTKSTHEAIMNGSQLLQKQLQKPIAAIVPVEIGPYSVASAFEMADILGVPVVDGDLVGYRAVPDIFLELVTLAKLPRTPLVVGNNENDMMILDSLSSSEQLEKIARTFADLSKSHTYVLGYPYNKEQLGKCLAKGSVSYCLKAENQLELEFELIGMGVVTADVKRESHGFTEGHLVVSETAIFRIEFKNEYLVLYKNHELFVTCPEFICVVDLATGLGLNNGEDNLGKRVAIYVKPAIDKWRSEEGLSLFSPKNLGLDSKQKLL